jgi:hypothetical protein
MTRSWTRFERLSSTAQRSTASFVIAGLPRTNWLHTKASNKLKGAEKRHWTIAACWMQATLW